MEKFPDTMEEVIQKSIQMEKDGREFYLTSSKKITNSLGKRTLERLANDELIHISRFKELFESVTNQTVDSLKLPKAEISTFDEIFSRLNEQVDDSLEELSEVGVDDQEMLEIALDLENHTHLFYKKASEEMKEEKVKELYRLLAEEEKAHYDLLRKSLDFLSDPSLYLGMGGKL